MKNLTNRPDLSRLVLNLPKKILILIIPLYLLFANAILHAEENVPPWVLFQRAMNLYNQRNFGDAFKLLRSATERNEYPEAEYWIGRIFENEGENALALRQYERALAISYKAESDEFYIAVLLSIADIYEKQRKYNLYEETLLKIINDVKRAAKGDMTYERVLGDRLMDSGLDRTIYLFRYELDALIKPYGEIGIYYLKNARDRVAIQYLVSAVIIIFTRLIEANRDYDPQYEYTNIRTLFLDSEKENKTREYMTESELYKYLFFLTLALDNLGEISQSRELFTLLSESSVRNNYADISLRIRNSDFSSNYKDGVKRALLFTQED